MHPSGQGNMWKCTALHHSFWKCTLKHDPEPVCTHQNAPQTGRTWPSWATKGTHALLGRDQDRPVSSGSQSGDPSRSAYLCLTHSNSTPRFPPNRICVQVPRRTYSEALPALPLESTARSFPKGTHASALGDPHHDDPAPGDSVSTVTPRNVGVPAVAQW